MGLFMSVSKKVIGAAFLAVSLVSSAFAQGDLASQAVSDPNGFVRQVQQALKDAGTYGGSVNGQLTQNTISAINAACEAAGVLPECQVGPLSRTGASAIAQALSGASAFSAEAPAQEVATMSDAVAVEWEKTATRNGITTTATQDGSGTTVAASGTAAGNDYTNINGTFLEAQEGQTWSFELTGSFASSGQGSSTVRLSAVNADGKYLGELSEGKELSAESSTVTVTGTTPAGTNRVLPYIQLIYPAGASIDDTVTISEAAVSSSQ